MAKVHTSVEIDPQFNRTKNPNRKGEYPVYIMLRQERKKASIIPDIPNIPLEQFQKAKGNWILKKHPKAGKINLKISQLVNILDNYILDNDSRRLNPQEVKDWYLKNHTDFGDFKDFRSEKVLDFYEKKFKKPVNSSTLSIYKSALAKLEEFKPDTSFFDFNRLFIQDFASFLGKHKKIMGSSGAIYLSRIKTIYIRWYGENHKDDPAGYLRLFSKVKVKQGKSKENRGFSKSELDSFIALDLSQNLQWELVRDLTVFMCYSSRYLKELMALTFDNVYIDPSDSQIITIKGERSKTGVRFENPIFQGVQMEIFERYHPEKKGRLFPQIFEFGVDNRKNFITCLQELTILIGMGTDFKPGVKIGRSTFQSNIGRDLSKVAKMRIMGHTNTQTQDRYNSGELDIHELTKGRI